MKLITNHKGLIFFYVGVILVSFVYSARIEQLNELSQNDTQIVYNR